MKQVERSVFECSPVLSSLKALAVETTMQHGSLHSFSLAAVQNCQINSFAVGNEFWVLNSAQECHSAGFRESDSDLTASIGSDLPDDFQVDMGLSEDEGAGTSAGIDLGMMPVSKIPASTLRTSSTV